MRGTRWRFPVNNSNGGIIPAYAGNTNAMSWVTPWREDHPRICGEHVLHGFFQHQGLGSSPHMRGTRAVWDCPGITRGIIPAYAGNTNGRCGSRWMIRDHPRICGEHVGDGTTEPFRIPTDPGSSPHMRGTPSRRLPQRRSSGIIPAYAGNTLRDYSNFVVSKFMSFVFHLV